MADDLTKPLLGRQRRRRGGIQPVGIALTVIGAVLVGAVIWVIVSWDPDDTSGVAVPIQDATAAAEGSVVIRAPDAAATSGVNIFTPEGNLANEGVIIREVGALDPVVLTTTAIPALLEDGPFGPLPRIGADGLRPFDAYARPADNPRDAPMIAIIVGGLGLNQAGTEQAIARLPGEVTLAFAPYGTDLPTWAIAAREAGHEIFLQVPFEPFDFPNIDPGPHTLLVDAPAAENIDRLGWLMAQFTTYAGVVTYAGGRFTAETDAMRPVVEELAHRGLMLLDDGGSTRSRTGEVAAGVVPFARADLVLDQTVGNAPVDVAAVTRRLEQLEVIARDRGYAVASASAFAASIAAIETWAAGLAERGILLVPITAIADDPAGATTVRVP